MGFHRVLRCPSRVFRALRSLSSLPAARRGQMRRASECTTHPNRARRLGSAAVERPSPLSTGPPAPAGARASFKKSERNVPRKFRSRQLNRQGKRFFRPFSDPDRWLICAVPTRAWSLPRVSDPSPPPPRPIPPTRLLARARLGATGARCARCAAE